ncbi:tetratricopeptide repeat protein [Streptococcus ovuberis]|uniref:Tetratricopeptide repeat protein n=1 Tax=Streptococcus ovuberis TaxID=1936207 RepID=A0A7X6N231_9STRE|nr:tetratricopeptide repeat protein [Streptococcus ovuberis]NKZ20694.1 tetratricopeptide repeat protein [Streptococcus ovuberis]
MLDHIYSAFDLMEQGRLDAALALLDSLVVPEADSVYYDYLSTYGYVHAARKDYILAVQAYEAYLNKAVAEGDRLHQHRAHHQLCMVYREQGDFGAAMAELDKERAIISQHFMDDDLVWAVHLYEVGYVSHLLGDHDKAVSDMGRSLEHALKTDDLIAQACAYRGLGEIQSSAEHLIKAKALFEEAGENIGSQEIDDLLSHLP